MKKALSTSLFFLVLSFIFLSFVSFASENTVFTLSTPKIFGPGDKNIYINLSGRDIRYVDIKIYKLRDPLNFILNSKYKQNLKSYKFSYKLNLKEQILNDLWEILNNLQYSIRSGIRHVLPYDVRVKIKDFLGIKEFKELSLPEPPLNVRINRFLRDEEILHFFREYMPKSKKKGWWIYKRISLPIRNVGTYLIEGTYNGKSAYTLLIINKISMAVKATAISHKYLVFLEDKYSSTPLKGANIYIVKRDKILVMGNTDKDGIYILKNMDFSSRGVYIIASFGKELAISTAPYLWSENSNFEFYTYTDRPIYKPGHTVYFKSILRKTNIYNYLLPPIGGKVKVSLRDPDYNLIWEKKIEIDEFGTISGKIELSDEAMLGYYTISIDFNGKKDSVYFQVEEYEKPDFKLEVSSEKKIYKQYEPIHINLKATYYFGEPLRDGRVSYEIFAYPIPQSYDEEEAEVFVKEGNGYFDENGEFHLSIMPKDLLTISNSSLYINFYARDWKNKVVTTSYSVEYRVTDFLLDIDTEKYVYPKNEDIEVKIQAFDVDKKPVDINAKVTVKYIHWKEDEKVETIERVDNIKITGGEYKYHFMPKYAGSYIVEVGAYDSKKNHIKSYTYIWISGSGITYYTESLKFITDKKSYKQGDIVHALLILPKKDVVGLYTLEGKDIYEYKVLKVKGNTINIDIPLIRSYLGNVKIKFLFFKDGEYYEGYESIKVENSNYKLSLELIPDRDTYKPNEEGEILIKVKDAKGKGVKAEVSLGIVDESIYALVDEYANNIFDYFYVYADNYYDVSTAISYYFNFYGGAIDEAIINTKKKDTNPLAEFKGRGGMGPLPPQHIRNFFPDTLYFNPSIITDENGVARVKVVFPDSLTSFRIVAKAITLDTKVGETKKNVYVKKDIFSRMDIPPFGIEGDEVDVSGIVHNYTNTKKNLRLKIRSSKNIKLKSETNSKMLTVPSGREEGVPFKIKLVSPGKAIVRMDVSDNKMTYDALERSFNIFPYGYHIKSVSSGILKKAEETLSLEFPKDTMPYTLTAKLEVDTSVIATLIPSFRYLVKYPYGCTEQTMSRLLPDIAVKKLLDLYHLTPDSMKNLDDMIIKGIRRLYRYQHSDGGWGWWEFDDSTISQTAYVLLGLNLFKENGYLISNDVLKRGFYFLFDNIQNKENFKDLNILDKAFALYVLTLWKDVSMKDRSYIKDISLNLFGDILEAKDVPSIAFSYMVLIFNNLNLENSLYQAIYELKQRSKGDKDILYWQGFSRDWYYITDVEATSWAGIALSSAGEKVLLDKISNYLLGIRRDDGWVNTRSTAISLLYLVKYLKNEKKKTKNWSFSLYVRDKKIGEYRGEKPATLSIHLTQEDILKGDKIRIEKNIGDVFYFRVYVDYWRKNIPSVKGPHLSVNYYKVTPYFMEENLFFSKDSIDKEIKINSEVMGEVTINTDEDLYNVIVEVPRPAGFEYIKDLWNYKVIGEEDEGEIPWYVFKEYRLDKVVFFVSYIPKGSIKLRYIARAREKGIFHILPPRLTLMYNPYVKGFGEKKIITIK